MLVTIPFIFGIYLIGHEALVLLANEEVAAAAAGTSASGVGALFEALR